MLTRALGRTGLQVSEIGYGAWGIGGTLWIGADDVESLRALHRAVDLGVNFIDTALGYGHGHSERLVGRLLRERRETIYVATKVPPKNSVWPAARGVPVSQCFPARHIVESCEKSLRHLSQDHVDLLQLHTWQDEYLDQDGWREALVGLKKAGKARFLGISVNDHDPDSAMRAVRSGLFDTVQVIYNIFDQGPQRALFPACQERGLGVLARVPFDEGSLTGAITTESTFPDGDFRNHYFGGDRKQQVSERVLALRDLLGDRRHVSGGGREGGSGGERGPSGGTGDRPERSPRDEEAETLAELALRFCLSHEAVSTVIPGMRRVGSVEANARVSDGRRLSPGLLKRLEAHAWARNFYS